MNISHFIRFPFKPKMLFIGLFLMLGLSAPGCHNPNFTGRYDGEIYPENSEPIAASLDLTQVGESLVGTAEIEDTGTEAGQGAVDRTIFSLTTKSSELSQKWTQTTWNGRGADVQGTGKIDTISGDFIQKTFTTDGSGEPQLLEFRSGTFVVTKGPEPEGL